MSEDDGADGYWEGRPAPPLANNSDPANGRSCNVQDSCESRIDDNPQADSGEDVTAGASSILNVMLSGGVGEGASERKMSSKESVASDIIDSPVFAAHTKDRKQKEHVDVSDVGGGADVALSSTSFGARSDQFRCAADDGGATQEIDVDFAHTSTHRAGDSAPSRNSAALVTPADAASSVSGSNGLENYTGSSGLDINYSTNPELLLRPGELDTGGPPPANLHHASVSFNTNIATAASSSGFVAGSSGEMTDRPTNPTVMPVERADVWDDSGSGANPRIDLIPDVGVQGETGNISDAEDFERFDAIAPGGRRHGRSRRSANTIRATAGPLDASAGASDSHFVNDRVSEDMSGSGGMGGAGGVHRPSTALESTEMATHITLSPPLHAPAQSSSGSSTSAAARHRPEIMGTSEIVQQNALDGSLNLPVETGSNMSNAHGRCDTNSPSAVREFSYRKGGQGYPRWEPSCGSSSAPVTSYVEEGVAASRNSDDARARIDPYEIAHQSVRELLQESEIARRAFEDVQNKFSNCDVSVTKTAQGRADVNNTRASHVSQKNSDAVLKRGIEAETHKCFVMNPSLKNTMQTGRKFLRQAMSPQFGDGGGGSCHGHSREVNESSVFSNGDGYSFGPDRPAPGSRERKALSPTRLHMDGIGSSTTQTRISPRSNLSAPATARERALPSQSTFYMTSGGSGAPAECAAEAEEAEWRRSPSEPGTSFTSNVIYPPKFAKEMDTRNERNQNAATPRQDALSLDSASGRFFRGENASSGVEMRDKTRYEERKAFSLSPSKQIKLPSRNEPNWSFFDTDMRQRSLSSARDPRSARSHTPVVYSFSPTGRPLHDTAVLSDDADAESKAMDESSIRCASGIEFLPASQKNSTFLPPSARDLNTSGNTTNQREATLRSEMDKLKAQHEKDRKLWHRQVNKLEAALRKKESRHAESQSSSVASRKQSAKLEKETKLQKQMIEKLRAQNRVTEQQLCGSRANVRKLEDKIVQMTQASGY